MNTPPATPAAPSASRACVATKSPATSYQRAREYSPRLGRFLQRDPLGYPDGMNTYAAYHVLYGGVDPWGLSEVGGVGSGPPPYNPQQDTGDAPSPGSPADNPIETPPTDPDPNVKPTTESGTSTDGQRTKDERKPSKKTITNSDGDTATFEDKSASNACPPKNQKKPGFLKRIFRKLPYIGGIATGAAFVSGEATAGEVIFDSTPIGDVVDIANDGPTLLKSTGDFIEELYRYKHMNEEHRRRCEHPEAEVSRHESEAARRRKFEDKFGFYPSDDALEEWERTGEAPEFIPSPHNW